MIEREQQEPLAQDRQDLLEVIRLRFGEPDPALARRIEALSDAGLLQHLILIAANDTLPLLRRQLGLSSEAEPKNVEPLAQP